MEQELNQYEIGLLQSFMSTEFADLYFKLLQAEIKQEEDTFDVSAKISNDPINADWRFKRGEISGMKKALNLSRKYINNLM
jgi:hypothetical protein